MPAKFTSSRNNVTDMGKGSPLIFSHGYGCDQNVWNRVIPGFSDRRVILFDHVGAGKSDTAAFSPFKYRTLNGYAADLVELCDELELRDVTLVAHSVSAIIGALAAIERPDLFVGLVMVAPSPCYINHDDYVGGFTQDDIEALLDLLDSNHMGWSSAMAPIVMGNPERPELSRELEASFCRTDPTVARHFARVTFTANNLLDIGKVAIPTLILQCSEDKIAPSSVGTYMHGVMPGSKLVMMEAKGHCPHISAPEETIEEIRSFLLAQTRTKL
jgi:sigma-B regulation protein RsbQ